jgi:IMP dehydrogenase
MPIAPASFANSRADRNNSHYAIILANPKKKIQSGDKSPHSKGADSLRTSESKNMPAKIADQGITFDDVLLAPRLSEVVPADASVKTRLTKRIELNIPLLSSPMDTVTESEMAIALAQEGGLGVIHRNMSIDNQAKEVEKVKRSANGIIVDPVTLPPTATVARAKQLMDQQNISGVPITVDGGKLVGILTRRDLRFVESSEMPISEVMTKPPLVTATGNVTLEQAEKTLTEKRVEKLLLVDEKYRLTGLITIKDIDMMRRYPDACKDRQGRLRAGAAVGVRDYERMQALIDLGVDVLVVDSAHGHSRNVLDTVKEIKRRWDIDVIAGNVATAEGARDLIKAGADAVKVGIGPGSICTTRVISGVGVPQITAIIHAAGAAEETATPIIADGGIRYSGDITKAIAAGAHSVMIGGLFAGMQESPGQTILFQGRTFKVYRGMGSLGAMVQGSSERYRQRPERGPDKLVPEGVEGRVPYKGSLGPFVYQLVGGLRAGMGYVGARSIEELRKDARFIQVSAASVRESHPHDIAITQEAPNYSAEFSGEQ